jgi:hypothetical protein
MMAEGGDDKPADENAAQQSAEQPEQEVTPPDGNKIIATKTVAIFAALELVALVLWMFAELFHDKNQYNLRALFLWLAMSAFLAGATHIVAKAFKKTKPAWITCAVICLAVGFGVYGYTRPVIAHNIGMANDATTINVTNFIVVTNATTSPSDYIPGTDWTESELRNLFPFGYCVISFTGDKWTYEVPPQGSFRWDISWNLLRIVPNFTKRTVHWVVPGGWKEINKAKNIINIGYGNQTEFDRPMTYDRYYPVQIGPLRPSGDPWPCVITLSDNQRSPVFAFGFRLVPEEDERVERLRQKRK